MFFIRDLLRLIEQELSREIDRRGGATHARDVYATLNIVRNASSQLERVKA